MKKPEVTLVNFTEEALELLIYTKSGRLATGTTLEEIMGWPEEQKMEHLDYMMNTIKTSFEFVDYVFEIKNVSRAFTHQLVRTRTASFQQQAMRVVDASEFDHLVTTDHPRYESAAEYSKECYAEMLQEGVAAQDARGVLPTAIHTQIMMKANLRTLSNMAELRLCKRAEGEYQGVFKQMVDEVLKIHPWAEPLLRVYCGKYGICAFPRYDKCPIAENTYNVKHQGQLSYDEVLDNIMEVWEKTQHVANPVANKDGMTM